MADPDRTSGDQPENTATLRKGDGEQLLVINRKLDRLVGASGGKHAFLTKENAIAIFASLIVLALAALGAWGISSRLDALSAHVDKVEDRLGTKIDKLDDRFLKLDEAVTRALPAKH